MSDIFGRTGQTPGGFARGRAGGAGTGVTVTGLTEVDKELKRLIVQVPNKFIRRALNESLKIVEADFHRRMEPHNRTGAMDRSVRRRTPKGTKRGIIARSLMISRNSLAKSIKKMAVRAARALFKGKHGVGAERAIAVAAAQEQTIDIEKRGFYPAFVELGDKNTEGQRPMRGALYGNEQRIRAEFVNQLRQAVASAGK